MKGVYVALTVFAVNVVLVKTDNRYMNSSLWIKLPLQKAKHQTDSKRVYGELYEGIHGHPRVLFCVDY